MVSTWSWNFGDGSTSALQNPTHVFESPLSYTVTLTAIGPGGTNVLSSPIVVTAAAGSGLVAAYGFEEGSGTTVIDASGNGNVGLIDSVEWTTSGRFGKALQFNGNGWVTVAHSASLLLNTMTLEAWVYPTVKLDGWIDLIMKEASDGASYYLCANSQWGVPVGGVTISEEKMVLGPAALPLNEWSHLATTYDGSYQRLYFNGVLVSTQPQQGRVSASGGALRLGGDSVWGERFTGLIDEVRIYNRALSSAEIHTDMAKPISQQ
jgi:PKD repeat protein